MSSVDQHKGLRYKAQHSRARRHKYHVTSIERGYILNNPIQAETKRSSAAPEHNVFDEKRARQNAEWLNKLIHEMIEMRLKHNPAVQETMPSLQKGVINNTTTPYKAAQKIVDLL